MTREKFRAEVREWTETFIIVFIAVFIIKTFIVEAFAIPSGSMIPTLKVGDRIFVNKFIYGARIPFTDKRLPSVRDPKRGDIVVFIPPDVPNVGLTRKITMKIDEIVYGAHVAVIKIVRFVIRQPDWQSEYMLYPPETLKDRFIKRLIATGGERVEIKNENIYINGKRIEDPVSISGNRYYNRGDYGREGVQVTVPDDSYFMLGDNSDNSRDSRYWGFVPKKNVIGKAICIYWPVQRIRAIK